MATITPVGTIEFTGDIRKPKNLSGIESRGDFLVLGADETNLVQILKRQGDSYAVERDVILNAAANEIDLEGISQEGDFVYVAGSHSCKRKKIDPEKPYEANRAAMVPIIHEPDRDRLFRFRLSDGGEATDLEETTLAPLLDGHAILERFRGIPSKENGIDIEGLAVRDGLMYLGFRGPVLRGNWVPVLKCAFANPITEAELLFVELAGYGIRDLARVEGGFLILAGPLGDGAEAHTLSLWDGRDCLPGTRTSGRPGTLVPLGELPARANARPEGMTVLREDSAGYEILVVHDGVKNGDPTRFRVSKS